MKNQGIKEEEHEEFKELSKVLRRLTNIQQQYRKRVEKIDETRKPDSSAAPEKTELLRSQIQSFKLLSRNLDIPGALQTTLLNSLDASMNGEKEADNDEASSSGFIPRDIDMNDFSKRATAVIPEKTSSFSDDSSVINGVKNSAVGGVSETIIRNRLTQRMAELEAFPSNLGTFDAHKVELQPSDEIKPEEDTLKIKALIELKSLRLLTKQKSLRQHIVYNLAATSEPLAESMATRSLYKRYKVQTAQELRLTEQLELQQRMERERKQRIKRLQYVEGICDHSNEIFNDQRIKSNKYFALGKSVLNAHSMIEKEESRRAERTAKQRLAALRANDEDAYLKLLDQTKDTRITHLLRQTNSFLKSLSEAVRMQQQQDSGGKRGGAITNDADEDEAMAAAENNEEDEDNIDYYNVAHRIQEGVTAQPSILVGGDLKEYQIKGLQWMVSLYNNNLNGILADEMGLGKTIQSISLITYLIEFKKQPGPYLVIVPLSTLTNWNMEFEKWAPSVRKVVYKGPPNARKGQQSIIRSGDFQVVLTTYEYIIKDRPVLSKLKWTYMIIDEGHRMKNANSKLSATLTQYYYSRHRLILTGTPLQNNLPELWALLNFVLPKIFNSVKTFDEWFNTPFANTGGQDKMELTEEETLLIIRRLHKVLRPFLLRRLKKDVEKDLPDKIEKVIKCKMSGLQAKLYDQMLQYNVMFVGSTTAGEDGQQQKPGVKGLNNKIMQLRKICNHPYVFEEIENAVNPSKGNNDNLWRVAGKFELLDRILPKFKATGHRVLIFFQMTQVMDIMEDFLRWRGLQYLRLDGATRADERSNLLNLFNEEDSPYFAFLLSTRAGGLGLNLQSADTVIIFDTDWNPHQDLQAQDRAHRIGQTKEVRILRLITEHSVEEVILNRAHAKLEIDGKVIQAGKFDNKSTAEEQEEFLRKLLENEEGKLGQKEEDEDMDDDELNDILARNENEEEIFKKFDNDRITYGEYGRDKEYDRLMSVEELPSEYQTDIKEHLEKETKVDYSTMGRGARERRTVYYDDGLTEEQWLEAVDNDEDTLEEAIERKRLRQQKRIEKQQAKAAETGEIIEEDATHDIEDVTTTASTPHAIEENGSEDVTKNGGGGKRKRTRSVRLSIKGENNDLVKHEDDNNNVIENDTSSPRPTKRKAKSRNSRASVPDTLSTEERERLNKEGRELIDAFKSSVAEDGRDRSELFLQLPNKKMYPDYYVLIQNPIALDKVESNIENGVYTSLSEIKEDFDLMLSNAKTYNEPGSFLYNDSEVLEDVVNTEFKNLTTESKVEPVEDEEEKINGNGRRKSGRRSSRPSIKLKVSK